MDTQNEPNLECCPPFDYKLWDDKIVVWKNKRFIKDKVFTLFFMPINFGKVIKRMHAIVEEAGAKIPERICLSEHTSKRYMDMYLAVDREIPNVENITLSGKFYCRVYEGPFKNTGKWCKDFRTYAKLKGYKISNLYLWYTTCPKCAILHGKNYVVILSEIKDIITIA